MGVQFAPTAVRDIEEIGDFIYADNPVAAVRFITKLRERCERISSFPGAGNGRPELMEGLRSALFQRYVIFYTYQDAEVRIERVLHGARDILAAFDPEI